MKHLDLSQPQGKARGNALAFSDTMLVYKEKMQLLVCDKAVLRSPSSADIATTHQQLT
jgi:hypothetical protein